MQYLLAAAVLLAAALASPRHDREQDFGSRTEQDAFRHYKEQGLTEEEMEAITRNEVVEGAGEADEEEDPGFSWRAANGYSECEEFMWWKNKVRSGDGSGVQRSGEGSGERSEERSGDYKKGDWHKEGGKDHVDCKPMPLDEICRRHECPKMEVLPSGCGYEARKILGAKWVGTKMGVDDVEAETRAAFWRLFKYIGGDNDQDLKIEMTVPVITKWFWNSTDPTYALTGASMHFYLPAEVADNAPVPTGEGVSVEEWEDTVVYDRAFGGNERTDEVYTREFTYLAKAVVKDGKTIQSGVSVTAGYTRPHHGRQRSEVMFIAGDE